MADHKIMIGGTTYKVRGGQTLVGGTTYNIKEGKTLINGTTKSIPFTKEVPIISNGIASMEYTALAWNYIMSTNSTWFGWGASPTGGPDGKIMKGIYNDSIEGIFFPQIYVTSVGGGTAGGAAYGFFGPINLAETPKIIINCMGVRINGYKTDGTAIVINGTADNGELFIGYIADIPATGEATYYDGPNYTVVYETSQNPQITNIIKSGFAEYQYTIPSVSSGLKYLVIGNASSYRDHIFIRSLTLSN